MSHERPSVAIVGVGAMGGALLSGLLDAGWPAETVTLIEAHEPRAAELRATTGCRTVATPVEGIDGQEVVVVAVKPQGIHPALEALRDPVTTDQVVVALVAGVPLSVYEAALPGVPVIRTMPNTPALVGEGITAMASGRQVAGTHEAAAKAVLSAVGAVEQVDEPLIDAVTAVSGSGPAYAYLLAEAMRAAGVEEGLDADMALRLAAHTIRGAGTMMVGSEDDPSVLRQRVTSPGGTTAAALAVMEARGLTEIIGEAIAAAATRSRELGREAAG